MILRPATMADAERLFAWRNDPQTRAASHEEAELEYDSHCDWLRRSLATQTRRLYIAEMDGVPVGMVRADSGNEATELSWTVAPERRGSGMGTAMVGAAVALFTGTLRAQVKRWNLPSRRIAEHSGFQLDRQSGEVLHYLRPGT